MSFSETGMNTRENGKNGQDVGKLIQRLHGLDGIAMDTAGSINEEGFLHSLGERQGVNKLSSLDELFANAIDAKSKRILCRRDMAGITINDDGVGMTRESLIHMFDMYRLQRRFKTIGNYGIGGKMGMFILSDKSNMRVITLHDGIYMTANVPWKDILETKTYSNSISVHSSVPEEIHLFQSMMERTSGTTILMPPNEDTWMMIHEQFDISNHPHLDPEKSMVYKFGRFDPSITYLDSIFNNTMTLAKYNPSLYVDPRLPLQVRQINVYKKKGEYRFITDDEREIKSTGGTKGKPRFEKDSTGNAVAGTWTRVGTFKVELFSPKDEERQGASTWFPPHLKQVFLPNPVKDLDTSKLAKLHDSITVFKSDYPIGKVSIERNTSSKRASFEATFYFGTHANLHYDTEDSSELDSLIGIQENKNQLQDVLPIPIKRLIHEMRTDYSSRLFKAWGGEAETETKPEPKVTKEKAKAKAKEKVKPNPPEVKPNPTKPESNPTTEPNPTATKPNPTKPEDKPMEEPNPTKPEDKPMEEPKPPATELNPTKPEDKPNPPETKPNPTTEPNPTEHIQENPFIEPIRIEDPPIIMHPSTVEEVEATIPENHCFDASPYQKIMEYLERYREDDARMSALCSFLDL